MRSDGVCCTSVDVMAAERAPWINKSVQPLAAFAGCCKGVGGGWRSCVQCANGVMLEVWGWWVLKRLARVLRHMIAEGGGEIGGLGEKFGVCVVCRHCGLDQCRVKNGSAARLRDQEGKGIWVSAPTILARPC